MNPSQAMRNIELKARCPDLAGAARTARTLGATPAGVLIQVDTYFHVPTGRLKLRETEGRPAELIAYVRPNSPDVRGSAYHLVPIADASQARTALASVLGIRGQVRKGRELLLWHNVRIHLDQVERLGNFLEFEAVISAEADETASLQHLRMLREAFSIRDEDLVAVSYSDLLGF